LLAAQRLVHRDISPRNVRFAADGRAKLIDFGALVGFGPASDIVGTPPCMAPEVLSKTALDQRTDLYALGAVAYWALTGRHAYPARRLDELPELWRAAPPAPSKWVTDIPPALDALVLSLLRVDPLSRPSSAAAVIDELSVIGELPVEEPAHAAESYLLSGRMVGRQEEQEWLAQRLGRALNGQGQEVVIDGPPGIGKTRLLYETALVAQLKGMAVLSADGEALPQPFGLANALAMQLLTTSREQALPAASPHAAVLGHVSEALRESLGMPALAALSEVPAERRAQLQAALYGWFLAVTSIRPLLIAIDNLQAVDDNSAAFLAALGLDAKNKTLFTLCSQRTGDPVRSQTPVRALRARSAHLKLGPLGNSACVDLVHSLFGEVANAGRLSYALRERSRGNPQHFVDLAALLVKRQIATYAGGTWVLPFDLSDDELPRGAALSEARLQALAPAARSILDALSIHDRPVSLELSLELAEVTNAGEAHRALDALVAEQLLVLEDGHYRFARDAQQKALYDAMPDDLRRRRHRRMAALLIARGDDDAMLLQAGRHLLHAGDESAGADLIAPLGRRLFNRGADQPLSEIVMVMQAALAVYEREGRPALARAELMLPMLNMAYYTSEWRLLFEFGERGIELGCEITGLRRAEVLRRWLGRKLALIVSALASALLFLVHPRRNRGWHMGEALKQFLGLVPAVCGTLVLGHDIAPLERILRHVDPLRWLGPDQPLTFLHGFACETLNLARGRLAPSEANWAESHALLHRPSTVKALGDAHVQYIDGGMLCGMAVIQSYRSNPEALHYADRAAAGGLRMWALGATQARLLYHALRGESEEAQRHRAEMELLALQGGSTWQLELTIPCALLGAEFMTGDTIGVRRIHEQLSRRARVVGSLQPYAEAAQAMYLTLRDQLPEALAQFEQVVPRFAPFERAHWMLVHAAFAQALIRSGQHARARDMLTAALAHLTPADLKFVCLHLEGQRQLALAEAGLEHHAKAATMLEDLLAAHTTLSNPLLVGLLHKARAEVALMVGDDESFAGHFTELERNFRRTRNPALIAQCERLFTRAVEAGMQSAVERDRAAAQPFSEPVFSAHLSQLQAAGTPFEHVLKVIVQHSGAKTGYLYALVEGSLRMVAANRPDEPPPGLEAQLFGQVERDVAEEQDGLDSGFRSRAPEAQANPTINRGSEDDERTALVIAPPDAAGAIVDEQARTAFVEAAVDDTPQDSHCVRVLRARHKGRTTVVGGVILELDPERPLRLPRSLLDAVADVLHARGTILTQ
jgi:hypothetical protein